MAKKKTLEETAVEHSHVPADFKVDKPAFIELCTYLSRRNVPVTLNNLLVNMNGLIAAGDVIHDKNSCTGQCRYYSALYNDKPDLTFWQLRQEQPETHLFVVYAVYCAMHKLGLKV